MTIGVLALQGDFALHQKILNSLGVENTAVRYPEQLESCQGLIIPGGESTTLTKQMKYIGLREPILDFAQNYPVFGTCAGLVMMGREVQDPRVDPLCLLDARVLRNGWGRQVHSSTETIQLNIEGTPEFNATFIRAPGIDHTGKSVEILASFDGNPVFIKEGRHMATTFHPELGMDTRIHEYFLDLIHV